MKHLQYLIVIIISNAVLSCGGSNEETTNRSGNDSLGGKISMSGAFALYPMAVKWSEEYHKLFPHVTFDVQAGGAGKGITDALSGTVDAGMVSRSISPEEMAKGAWPLAVAKDATVPIINDQNPYINIILKRGLSKNDFQRIWIQGNAKTWNDLLGNGSKEKVQAFTRSDASGSPETWAKYLGGRQEDLKGVGIYGDPGVAEAVSKDNLAIGFVNVNYVYDNATKKPFPGLRVAPIDINNNGEIDADENFYDNIDQLNGAISEAQFPSPPAKELYFVFKGEPSNPALLKFLKWVLADGQQFLPATGYVKLPIDTLSNEAEKLK